MNMEDIAILNGYGMMLDEMWEAQIEVGNEMRVIGYFKTEELALQAGLGRSSTGNGEAVRVLMLTNLCKGMVVEPKVYEINSKPTADKNMEAQFEKLIDELSNEDKERFRTWLGNRNET